MSFCLQGLRVLLTDLGPDQQIKAEQLASKLGATLISAVSNTLPDVLIAGRAGSLTCKVTRVLSAAPLPELVLLPSSNIVYLTMQNVRQAKDVPIVSPAWLDACARAGVQASLLVPRQGTHQASCVVQSAVLASCWNKPASGTQQALAHRLPMAGPVPSGSTVAPLCAGKSLEIVYRQLRRGASGKRA